jgi:F-type H+-transporting ATPase subunit epsilon
MNITVLTPDKQVFKGAITSVKVPGTNGQFQILKNHAPIVSSLEAGEVFIVTAASGEYRYYDTESGAIKTDDQPGRTIKFAVSGGFIEVLNNEVSLLVQGIR